MFLIGKSCTLKKNRDLDRILPENDQTCCDSGFNNGHVIYESRAKLLEYNQHEKIFISHV